MKSVTEHSSRIKRSNNECRSLGATSARVGGGLLTIETIRTACIQLYFFFSSRRRHTRFDCDWSSDVCSSDLLPESDEEARDTTAAVDSTKAKSAKAASAVSVRIDRAGLSQRILALGMPVRRSEERRVGKGVDLGGRRIIKKKKKRYNA